MDRERRAAGVTMALLRLARGVEAEEREAVQGAGFTPAQVAALRFAARTRPDVATPGQLARVLGVRPATAVGIVNPLVARGLVARAPHPFDGRQSVLTLTPAGWQAWRRVEAWRSGLEAALGELAPGEFEALEAALGKVVAALARAGRLVVSAPCAGCVHFRPGAHPGSAQPHHCALIDRALGEAEAAMECPEHTPAA